MERVGIVVVVIAAVFAGLAIAFREPERQLPLEPSLDALTEVKPSRTPGAGLGLFARAPIAAGGVIGHSGGRLMKGKDVTDSSDLVKLEPCAADRLVPFRYVDGLQGGGQVIRINFAPKTVNGVQTHLQNAAIDTICDPPYVVFRAIADIRPGQEILTSYGSTYHDDFMEFPDVRAHFCKDVGGDCSKGFAFEP